MASNTDSTSTALALFALTGRYGGREVTIGWSEGGVLSGDAEAGAMVRLLAGAYEGYLIGKPGAPRTTTDHLGSPYTACMLMHMVFDDQGPRGATITGELPKLTPPPEGAVP